VSFSGSGSSDPQGQTLTYAWNFGDSGTGTGVSPTHTYATPGSYTVSLTVTNTSNLSSTATVKAIIPNGRVYGGQQPVAGAYVYLFAANTTGYGQASVSLLSAAATGTSDSVGAYVLTSADGGFLWNGDYTCTPGSQVYLYALGGNAGAGTNSAAGLMAVLGNCPSTGNFSAIPYFTVNEVTTIAAAYAFAGFATDATHVSSSGTALAQVGIANAFANAANLVTLSTGTAMATTPAGNGEVPQAQINTLANVLADCVETSGPGSNGCELLFSNAMSGGSSGTAPTDTATAAINIAHKPAANVGALYGLASSGPFTPTLIAQPNDFTIAVNFTGSGLAFPTGIAIDGSGNAWVANEWGGITELSPSGAAISPATGYRGGSFGPYLIAIDGSGNAWFTSTSVNTLSEFSSSGTLISPANGYTGGGLSSLCAIAIDGLGDVWGASGTGNIAEVSNSGTPLSPSNGYTGGQGFSLIAIDGRGNVWAVGSEVAEFSASGAEISPSGGFTGGGLTMPYAMAIDALGNIWITNFIVNYGPGSVVKFSNSGVALSPSTGYTGGGLGAATGIAIDGAGNVWVGNTNYVLSEFTNAGLPLSPSTGFTGGGLSKAAGIVAVDGSGDVWATSQGINGYYSVTEFIGAGIPVVTPLAVGVKNNTLGTRP
jgi:PKD repeat protein